MLLLYTIASTLRSTTAEGLPYMASIYMESRY